MNLRETRSYMNSTGPVWISYTPQHKTDSRDLGNHHTYHWAESLYKCYLNYSLTRTSWIRAQEPTPHYQEGHTAFFLSHPFSIALITVDFCQLQVVLGWHLRNNSAGGWEKYVGMIHQNRLTPRSLLNFFDTASFPLSIRCYSNSLKCLPFSPS